MLTHSIIFIYWIYDHPKTDNGQVHYLIFSPITKIELYLNSTTLITI